MSVEDRLQQSIFSKFNDPKSGDSINKKDYNNAFTIFRNLLGDIRKEANYKKPQSDLEAYKLLNKFFWKVFGVNFVYSKKLNDEIDAYNKQQATVQGDKISNKHWFRREDNESTTGKLVKPNQIINPVSDSDKQRTIYYFVNNIDKFIDKIFDNNKEIILYFLNKTSSSAPSQTPTVGSKTPPWANSIEIPDMVSKHVDILKVIFRKIDPNLPFPENEKDFKRAKDAYKDYIIGSIASSGNTTLTIEQIVFLMRAYFLSYLPLSKKIKDAAKKPEEQQGTEVAAKGDKGSRRRGSRGSPARRAGTTVASTYNIRKAPRDRWIGGYQTNLKKFYTDNQATKELASNYEAGKLTDGRYGYRTHFVTIKAAENIISQLDKFLKPKATAKPPAKPAPTAPAAATPAPAAEPTNERRIKQLSKLLETKLVGSELNLFNEQDTPASDADKKKKLQALLTELQQIKGRLATAHSENSRPKSDASVQGKDLARFNEILGMLSWNTNGEIDFNEVYKKMQPTVAATKEPATEREKIAQVARTIRGTCWFDFDPNVGKIRSGTPIEVWAAADADFEEWYRQIVELFNYEGASPQFNYKSGAATQGRLKGAPSKLNDNKTQSISLACLSIHMTKLAENFYRNGDIATRLLSQAKGTNDEAKINKVRDGAKYFLKGDTYEGSVAHGLEQVLNRVIDILRSFRRGQIQQAQQTLANPEATEEAKEAAIRVIAFAKRDRKAVTVNAQTAKARAAAAPAAGAAGPAAGAAGALGTQNNPFKNQAAWSEWDSRTPAEQKKGNVVYYVYLGKDNKPLLQKIEYDATSGKMKPTAPAAAPAPTAAKSAAQQESLKQRREKLLNEAIFKKLVR
jgi:hypothetical protein